MNRLTRGSKDKISAAGGPAQNFGVGLANRGPEDALRHMPESLAAEAAVLGSMIIDPECIGQVVELLETDDFYRVEHRIIYNGLISLYEKSRGGDAIDAVLLRDELEKQKSFGGASPTLLEGGAGTRQASGGAGKSQLEEVGGVEYLAKVIDSVPSSANVMYYAGIVKDKSLLREIISVASEILEDAYGEGETSAVLDEAERRIFAVTDKKISGAAISLKDLVSRTYELIEKRGGSVVTGLATGYYELDGWTCGLQNGEMIIIAGRPSMGKTSLALNIAEHIAITERAGVAIFSLETGRQQLAERFLCSKSEIDSQLVRRGLLDTEHHEELVKACGLLSEAPIFIDDTSTLTPLGLRAKARRLKSQHDIRCIIVDYLQLMHLGSGRVESRQQEITIISRYIKSLARELNIPVVVLSQLNRAPEGREGHRPRMSDLRESGSIEQDADVVMLLHREDYYHRGEEDYEETNKAELIIAKQRNGPTAKVDLIFREKVTRFENASSADQGTHGGVPF